MSALLADTPLVASSCFVIVGPFCSTAVDKRIARRDYADNSIPFTARTRRSAIRAALSTTPHCAPGRCGGGRPSTAGPPGRRPPRPGYAHHSFQEYLAAQYLQVHQTPGQVRRALLLAGDGRVRTQHTGPVSCLGCRPDFTSSSDSRFVMHQRMPESGQGYGNSPRVMPWSGRRPRTGMPCPLIIREPLTGDTSRKGSSVTRPAGRRGATTRQGWLPGWLR
jgi:hypothetical protein